MSVNDPVTAPAGNDTGPIPVAPGSVRPDPVGAGPPRGQRSGRSVLVGVAPLLRAHRPFGLVLAVAALLRLVVLLGYPPALFFNDSYNYMTDAMTKSPDPVRADGYPLFLYLLLPFHSLNLVTAVQALLGLAMGAGIYAVLRRRGLPWWGATIPAVPVLFDVFELQLEHMVAADVLFYALITLVLGLLCWWDRPPLGVAILAGLATGYATTVRSVGEPLLVLVVLGMLARRMGWQRTLATLVAGLLPVLAYMVWFHTSTGKYALDESTGTFLYSRVQSFAECDRMNPPASLRVLCDPLPPSQRPISQEYLWADSEGDGVPTPLARLTGTNNIYRFTPQIESLTTKYARLAIESQPLSYVTVVAQDTLRSFEWTRQGTSDTGDTSVGNVEGSGSKFRFESTVAPVPGWVPGDPANAHAARDFGGANYGHPSVVRPWSTILQAYQKVVYLRGPFLLLILLTGAVGAFLGIRRKTRVPGTGWGGLSLLPWAVGVALLVLPAMTAGFSYRYALAAVPPLCLAAGLAFASRRGPWHLAAGTRGRNRGVKLCPRRSRGRCEEPVAAGLKKRLTLTLRQPSMLAVMNILSAASRAQGPAIQVQGLEKSYKELRALRGVDFDVARGSIFALLGSNGAGKTTVIKILSTLLKADTGMARVNGFDVVAHSADVRESISLTGQFAAVDEILSGRENLILVARLRHLKNPGAIADNLLGRFSLTGAGARRAATYSGGMRRRLDIAMSLIGNPPVIFLDEPTAGLDPEARIEVRRAVQELAEGGTTVLLTTQYLDEAEQLADRIAILHQGRIIVNGTLADLRELLPPAKVEYVEKQPSLEDIFLAVIDDGPSDK